MYNRIILLGNITRDIELKYLPSGSAVATIGLASNRRYKKQDGTMAEDPCFVDAKLFGRTAEIANQFLRKGSKILIEGRLSYETWSDSTGTKRSKHTIVVESMQMLDKKQDGMDNSYQPQTQVPKTQDPQGQGQPQTSYQKEDQIPDINIDDDEIPF
ncbi:MAG: single-stranded DNA-binding protein [Helicobacter sp.]|nr:single-stranded DNA-binding protein [Helicobacter sp.]